MFDKDDEFGRLNYYNVASNPAVPASKKKKLRRLGSRLTIMY